MKKYIITGGPNSGKSSIIMLLAQKRFHTLKETSRILIDTKNIMPWDNQELFCEEFRKIQLDREQLLTDEIIFLDRSLVDPIAYAQIAKCKINQSIYNNIKQAKYEHDVFFFEMLPQYSKDSQREESHEQALAIDKKLREIYVKLGFRLIDVPIFSENENESKKMRLQFIINHIKD